MKFALVRSKCLFVHLRFVFCRKVFVVFLGFFSFFSIIFAQACFCSVFHTRDVHGTLNFLFLLAFIVASNLLNSIHHHPSLHELSYNLRTRSTLCIFFDNIVHNLTICHCRLSKGESAAKKERKREKYGFKTFHNPNVAYYFVTHLVFQRRTQMLSIR